MRKSLALMFSAAVAVTLTTGCAGPSHKLGRGINNATEFTRLGDIRRSMEQTAMWYGPDRAYTTGFIQGVNRSLTRTVLGVAEIATFPIPTPSYDAFYMKHSKGSEDIYIGGPYQPKQLWSLDFMTEDPVYPTNFKPGLISDSTFATDTQVGFGSGDVLPMVPGSRFHIFDY
jgi:putative exosortase-associated protein (TIGR04073 family)